MQLNYAVYPAVISTTTPIEFPRSFKDIIQYNSSAPTGPAPLQLGCGGFEDTMQHTYSAVDSATTAPMQYPSSFEGSIRQNYAAIQLPNSP
jgi:hypothetical protein